MTKRHEHILAFAVDPENVDCVCSYCAIRVFKRFGGGIYGYWCTDNPDAVVGKSSGGHDFAIVDGRYLVDAWASEVEGLPLPAVIDLNTKDGAALVREWYGPRENWLQTRQLEKHVRAPASAAPAAGGGA